LPSRREKHEGVPEAELDVLGVLHDLGEADAMTVRAALESRRPMSHASVSTLLRRLEARGLVVRRKGDRGKAFLYAATEEAGGTHARVLRRMLERVFRNDSLSLVSALLEVKPPTAKEARALRKLVDDLHQGKKK
jgi:BlaI family transcriptional regulator, penicillinase repressor